MRDDDNAEAFGAEFADDFEQFLDFPLVEAGSRFVKDEQLPRNVERPRNGNHLLQRDGIRRQRLRDIDLYVHAPQGGFGAFGHGAPADHAEPRGLAAKTDVLRDGEMWDEIDLLINGADAQSLGG